MTSTNIEIILILKDFLQQVQNNPELRNHFASSQSFTRQRKLPLDRIAYLVISLLKRSLSVELEDFFSTHYPSEACVTKAAFCKQREKLHYSFFALWNAVLVNSFYRLYGKQIKRWNGLRLVAIDGSTSYLVNKPELFEHFGIQINQSTSVVMGRIMTARDVLNGINIFSQLYPINTSEQQIAYQWIPNLEKDMLAIYDRGFPSFTAMYLHLEQEAPVNFVVRCKNNFNKEVSCFSQSGCSDLLVEMKATNSAISELYKQGYKVTSETKVKVRLVKVQLPDGKTEILITSLLDTKKHPLHLFGELYFKRWGIETEYAMQKNYLQLELLSGYKVNTILQDFHASIFVSNLQYILSIPAQIKSEKKHKNRIYSYQINRNIAIENLKHCLITLFNRKNTKALIQKIEKLFARYIEPVRPDRQLLRIVKGKRTKGKYQTWTNYKRAI